MTWTTTFQLDLLLMFQYNDFIYSYIRNLFIVVIWRIKDVGSQLITSKRDILITFHLSSFHITSLNILKCSHWTFTESVGLWILVRIRVLLRQEIYRDGLKINKQKPLKSLDNLCIISLLRVIFMNGIFSWPAKAYSSYSLDFHIWLSFLSLFLGMILSNHRSSNKYNIVQ
jgi:hypothetical protein